MLEDSDMADISLWKRVGGWLRRSQGVPGRGDAMAVDSEGLLIAPTLDEGTDPERVATVTRANNDDGQVLSTEEGFARLVDVLESINENVSGHRRQDEEVTKYLAELADTVRSVPDAASRQEEAAKQLNEELRSQAVRQQQLVELMGNLPDLNEAQVDKLEEIRRQLSDAAEGEARMAGALGRFDDAAAGMSHNSEIQTEAVTKMATAAQANSEQLQAMLARQNRRLMLVALLGMVIVAGVAAAIVWLLVAKWS
jgi:hypothetical protein